MSVANLELLLPQLNDVIVNLDIAAEIIVVDAGSADCTADLVKAHGAP